MKGRRAQLGLAAVVIAVVALVAASFAIAAGRHDGKGKNDDTFTAKLNGYNETPSVNSKGRGTFRATVNSNNTISFRLEYSNLSQNPLVAHVHFSQKHVAGSVSYFLCGGPKPACPAATSGTVTGTVTAADIVGPAGQGIQAGDFASVVAAMRAGATYANMHTTNFPNGEIRGQLKGGHDDNEDDD
jgi:CHRD domain-containing protein